MSYPSYQALALKWRPQVFEDLVGQDAVTRTLKNAIQQNRIAQAFVFSGVRGVGKTTTARILAKALNCASGPTVRPCGTCSACVEIAASHSLDVLEIDAASNTGVDNVREIIEAARYAPSRDRFKIYIVDEVHMLSTAAFNALLKTLEEPPPRVKFIFATTEYHKIPDTILSRCQQFELRTLTAHEIAGQLKRVASAENLSISDAAVAQVARSAEGSLRDALSALDQVLAAVGPTVTEKDVAEILGLIDRQVLARAARAVVAETPAEIFRVVDELLRSGRDLHRFTRGLLSYFRDVLVLRVAPEAVDLVELATDPREKEELVELGSALSPEDLVRMFDLLTQTESALRWSPEPRFHLEVALLKLSELPRLVSFEELLSRFEALEQGKPAPPSPRGPSQQDPPPKKPTSDRARPVAPLTGQPVPLIEASRVETAPSVVAPETSLSAETVFDALLERIRTANGKLFGLLSHSEGASLEGGRLIIRFATGQEFFREQLDAEASRNVVEKLATEVAGRAIRIETALVTKAAPKAPVGAAAPPDALRQRALDEPLVRAFVETLQGEVEDVRPPESIKDAKEAKDPGRSRKR